MKPAQPADPVVPEDELTLLIRTLHETEQRIERLTAGEVDTVSIGSGRPFLLLRAQGEYQRSEAAKQAAILDALPARVAMLDAQGTIVSVNESWRQFAATDDMPGPAFGVGLNYPQVCDLRHGEDASVFRQIGTGIRLVLAGATAKFSLEYASALPAGPRWFLVTVTPLAEGRALGAVAMHLDITDRRLATEALRQSESEFRALAESVPQIVWVTRADGWTYYLNQQWTDYSGLTLEESVGQGWTKPFHPDDLPWAWESWQRAKAAHDTYSTECRLRRADGVYRWWLVRGVPQVDASGNILKWFGTCTDIHDLKTAEVALRESEQHFRFLNVIFEATRSLIDPEQIMAATTRTLGQHLGASRCAYADVEADGESFTILHDYTDGSASTVGKYRLSLFGTQAVATLRAGRTLIVRNVDTELLPGDGADMFNALGIKAIITCPLVKNGVLHALMAVHQAVPRDWTAGEIRIVEEVVQRCWAIIERRSSEERLSRSEALLRIASRTAHLGGWALELQGDHVNWSEGVFTILDLLSGAPPTLEEALKYVAPPSLAPIRSALTLCMQQGTSFDLELGVVTATGREKWVRCTGEARRGADGVITGAQGAFQDITERKREQEALQESERHFRALFDQAAVGVAQVHALTRRFVQVNQRFCEIVGRRREDLLKLTFADITHPEDLPRDQKMLVQMVAGEQREYSREKRYVRGDGSAVWVDLTVSAMWGPGESPGLCVAIVQDITARKRLDSHLLQTQKMEALGQFSGGVAHDFNNILMAIGGYADLSRSILKDNPEVREYLGEMLQATERAAALVRQILTFSRQQTEARLVMAIEPVVVESLKLLRATIPATIEFVTTLDADAPLVLANASQVHQILMNLGINAWHAMKGRPGRLEVTLERHEVDALRAESHPGLRPGLYTRLCVSDTGCGMEPAVLGRIFEPFFTTRATGEGTGLGLAVVHGIMESHQGAVTVHSRPGEGTRFCLYFPANAGKEAATATGTEPTPRGRGERILVVDDEDVLVRLSRKVLSGLGYLVESTTRPAEALEMVRADPARFALVLTDETMPGMTGMTLAREIHGIQPGLPIILMTGYSPSLTPEIVKAVGIRQLLLKPTGLRVLAVAVRAALSLPSTT